MVAHPLELVHGAAAVTRSLATVGLVTTTDEARMAPPDLAFAAMLSARLSGEVSTDAGTRSAYAADASNHRVVPACVVFPRHVDDVVSVVDTCRREGVPVTARGAGTNIAGNAIGRGVVLDFERHLRRVLSVDPHEQVAVVEPGVVLDALQRRLAPHGLRFGPDPSTHDRCTVGGMLGTNACGSHSVAWGTTSDNTRGLEVVLADGGRAGVGERREVHGAVPALPEALSRQLTDLRDGSLAAIRTGLGRFGRQISGYGLHHLLPEHGFDVARALVGSEGTCAVITSATLSLVRLPEHTRLLVIGCTDIVHAASLAARLVLPGVLTIEGMDIAMVRAFERSRGPARTPPMPAGQAWLLVDVGGAADHVADAATGVRRTAADGGAVDVHEVRDAEVARAIWQIREKGAGLSTRLPDGRESWPGWEDAAVPVDSLASYLTDFRALLADRGRDGVLYGHFGEGCVHIRIDHDLLTAQGREAYAQFQGAAADLVVQHGGSLTGEHGDGRARSALLSRMYDTDLIGAFGAFAHAFDPTGLLNPGIIVNPAPVDADLRLASGRRQVLPLAFALDEDDGDLGKALRRCVGVGACRSPVGGMCPSYNATGDDRHSTRGRARILSDLVEGRLDHDRWSHEAVSDALDLCLMCKACSSECPVSVDMATYKAEYLYQRYRGHRRPRAHYALGWLPVWLALARRMPRLANRLLSAPRMRGWLSRAGGLDPDRAFPLLADPPLRRARLRRGHDLRPSSPTCPSGVVLWVDTFTASFDPAIVADAVTVLTAAGLDVETAGAGQCCGLTWISTGQLDRAKRVLARTVAELDGVDGVDDSRPIVVLEPSCASALREESVALLTTDAAARVARRVVGLAEVLVDRELPGPSPDDGEPAPSVVAQFHCHQRATVGTEPDRALLERLGVEVRSVDEGCCGLAGNFGFEAGHEEVSRACADQSFRPYLVADPVGAVLADGFSCRTQINELGGHDLGSRTPMHLATLLSRLIGAGSRRG